MIKVTIWNKKLAFMKKNVENEFYELNLKC